MKIGMQVSCHSFHCQRLSAGLQLSGVLSPLYPPSLQKPGHYSYRQKEGEIDRGRGREERQSEGEREREGEGDGGRGMKERVGGVEVGENTERGKIDERHFSCWTERLDPFFSFLFFSSVLGFL